MENFKITKEIIEGFVTLLEKKSREKVDDCMFNSIADDVDELTRLFIVFGDEVTNYINEVTSKEYATKVERVRAVCMLSGLVLRPINYMSDNYMPLLHMINKKYQRYFSRKIGFGHGYSFSYEIEGLWNAASFLSKKGIEMYLGQFDSKGNLL